jgi:hypothetical protein
VPRRQLQECHGRTRCHLLQGVPRGKCQLCFALLSSFIRAFPAKRTISKFRSNSRAGTATPPSPRPAARTVRSAQLGTSDQALVQLSAPLAQQVGTGNSPARRARDALPSAQ